MSVLVRCEAKVSQLRIEFGELKSRVEILEREMTEVQEENRRLRELLPRPLEVSRESR